MGLSLKCTVRDLESVFLCDAKWKKGGKSNISTIVARVYDDSISRNGLRVKFQLFQRIPKG